MIYLLDGTEFKPEIRSTGKIKGISAEFNMSQVIYYKLKLASQTNELVHTQWLRGIGKTHQLIEFARMYGYAVIEPSMVGAGLIMAHEKYQEIYHSDINFLRGSFKKNGEAFIKDVVIDEGVTNIQEIKDAGFNIVTGYYTPKQESEMSFQEKVLSTLKNEIESLTPKLQKTRENGDYGSYKNLINAYREVLNLIRDFKLK